jgi:hypothetical protein
MAVQVEFEHDVEAVCKALTDPQFLAARNMALGEISAEYDVQKDKKLMTINAVREVRRELPGFLAGLFDPVNVMDMTEKWQADREGWCGDWTMDVRGQPVTLLGRFVLASTRSGCRYSVSHRARVRIPFLAGKIEKFILGQTVQGADDELEYLRNHLDQSL